MTVTVLRCTMKIRSMMAVILISKMKINGTAVSILVLCILHSIKIHIFCTKEDGDLDERKDLETSLIKRKRGRPKKIRSNEELEFVKAKRKNLRAGKMFKCPHCVKTFTRQHRVSIHIKLRHGFECTICSLKSVYSFHP